ncbi:MAG: PDZ domain-containing protein, partial [Gemmataceae bacterium]|nr:PDZ domain-containing protein [Gemmataceae bacterium]
EELGLVSVAVQDGAVRAADVRAGSPLARHDLRAGDVLLSIDGAKVASAADVRRGLRRGLVAGSATLRLRRDGAEVTRIVFLDGIPTPLAPAPRPAKP